LKNDILDGENKYECGKCEKKTEAVKGVRFKSLPPILTL